MGTRHLTCAVIDGEVKVAQYGQWDGYLSGQGQNIVDFISGLSPEDLDTLKQNVRKCVWVDEAEVEKRLESIGSKDGWLTMDQSAQWNANWPELSRDTGSAILALILKAPDGLALRDSTDFASDSLFCEFAYVVDLDKNVLEIYEGFQREAHKEGRFYDKVVEVEHREDKQYYPVKLIKTLKFKGLKESFAEFEDEYNKAREEEEAEV